jgi:hypothetical protein
MRHLPSQERNCCLAEMAKLVIFLAGGQHRTLRDSSSPVPRIQEAGAMAAARCRVWRDEP